MPLVGTRANASARAYGFTSGAPEVLGGMVLITPTSIASTGTGNSSSINANGSVTFSTCTALSLNGIFTSTYDNYMVVMRMTSSGSCAILARLRAAGSDATATTDYNDQELAASGATVGGSRDTSNGFWVPCPSTTTWRNGFTDYLYGPYLSQPTAHRSVTIDSYLGGYIQDHAGTHELSTSYDGMTWYPNASATMTGLISVYGLVGA